MTTQWHWLMTTHWLLVDDHPVVTGHSRGSFTQLTLKQGLFVGGHRNFDETAGIADVQKSFRGCIQKVSVVDYVNGSRVRRY